MRLEGVSGAADWVAQRVDDLMAAHGVYGSVTANGGPQTAITAA